MADEYGYEEEEMYSPYGGQSPLALLGMTEQYTTPEAQEYARKILKKSVDVEGDDEADLYLESVRKNAESTRAALREARERLAAQQFGKRDMWLAAAAGFGSPTKTGAFGESIGNVARNLQEPFARKREFNLNKDKTLLDMDVALSGVDEDVLKAQLELMKLRRGHESRMSVEALKQLGRRTGNMEKIQNTATNAVDRAMAKDYVEFIQTGASDSAKALEELESARDRLRGYAIDPETGEKVPVRDSHDYLTGPVVGTISKLPWVGKPLQDIAFPDSSDVQETVEYTVQRSLRPILGAQFTKEEGERLISRVYNPRLDEKVNAARLDRLIKQLQRAYQAKIAASRYFETHGTMRGFRGKLHWSVDDFMPDGEMDDTQEIFDDPIAGEPPDEPVGFPSVEELPELNYEDILPAGETDMAEGGVVGYAEGGDVEGRVPHTMPDGRVIWANPDVPYGRVLKRYSAATGQAFEEPAQAFEPDDGVVSDEPEDFSFDFDIPTAIELGGSAVGHGLLGAAGGRYGTKTAHGLADLIPGYKPSAAEARVLRAMEAEGLPPDQLAALVKKAQRLGVPVNLMDMGGIEMQALGHASMAPQNQQTRDLFTEVSDRQAGARGRVAEHINKALKPDDYFQMQRKLKGELQANSKPLYAELYKKYPALKSESLMQLMETPSGKRAVKAAAKAIRDRPGASLGKADAMGMITKPSLEFLDQVKDEFDDMITKEEMKGGVYKATKRGKRLRELRNALRNEVDLLTTDPKSGESAYKTARAQYSGDLEIMDALRFGREDFMKLPPGEIEQVVKEMNFSEKDALRTGVAQALFERVGKTRRRVNPAEKVIDTPEMTDKLKLLFDKPNEFKIFQEALNLEQQIFDDSQTTIRRGKSALSTTRDPKENILRRTAKKAPTLGIFSPTQWALRWLRRNEAISPKEADEIIRIMRTRDPKELAKLEKRLSSKYGRETARGKRTGKATMLGAAIGASIPLVNEFFGDDEEEVVDEEEQGFAEGGLVRSKADAEWRDITEQVLNHTMFGNLAE